MSNKDLAVREDYRDTRLALASTNELTQLANRFMAFPPQGKPLQAKDAAALAATAFMLDADPYNDELYPTPQGIQKGIMLYRRKAQTYCQAVNGCNYSLNFRAPKDGEIQFDAQAGDLAIVCELTVPSEHKEWERRWSEFWNMLYQASGDWKYADERATRLAGPEPIHIGYGIVDHRETFSGDEYAPNAQGKSVATGKQKPEMMARENRRNKRAEKAALRSAFPNLMRHIEAQENNGDFDLPTVVNTVLAELQIKLLEPPRHKQPGYDPEKELRDLGFAPTVAPVVEEAVVIVPDDTYDIDPSSYELTGEDSPMVSYEEEPEPVVSCKYGDGIPAMVIAANVGFKNIDKVVEAMDRSNWLAPAMDDTWYKMWCNFYVKSRKAGKNAEDAAMQADNNCANIKAAQQ